MAERFLAAEMPIVVVIKDNKVFEITAFKPEEKERAEKFFLESCRTHISNFDEYTPADIEEVVLDGSAKFGKGSVSLSWADVPDEDA